MKRLLAGCFAMMISTVVQSQQWDSTYRPAIYQLKKDQFEYFPLKKNDIVFLGNSITDYFEWNEYFGNQRVKNRGISGDITFGVLERLEPVIKARPAKIFILIGTNDISRDIPEEVIVQNIRTMIERIQSGSPKTKIYLHTLLPVNDTFGKRAHFGKDEKYLKVNKAIEAMGEQERVFIIDLYRSFVDADGRLFADLTYDGLHLNMKGYLKWTAILKDGRYL